MKIGLMRGSSSPESEDEVESAFFLDVVVAKSASIFELFSSKNQALLVRGYAFFVLDFLFDLVNGVRAFDLQSDGFASESFDEDLHLLFP
jgi:hypothetical protein